MLMSNDDNCYSTKKVSSRKMKKSKDIRYISLLQCQIEISDYLLHTFLEMKLQTYIKQSWLKASCYNYVRNELATYDKIHCDNICRIRNYFDSINIENFDIVFMAEIFLSKYSRINKLEMSPITFIQYMRNYTYTGKNFCKIIYNQSTNYLNKLPILTEKQIDCIKTQSAILDALQATTSLILMENKLKNICNDTSAKTQINDNYTNIPINDNYNSQYVPNTDNKNNLMNLIQMTNRHNSRLDYVQSQTKIHTPPIPYEVTRNDIKRNDVEIKNLTRQRFILPKLNNITTTSVIVPSNAPISYTNVQFNKTTSAKDIFTEINNNTTENFLIDINKITCEYQTNLITDDERRNEETNNRANNEIINNKKKQVDDVEEQLTKSLSKRRKLSENALVLDDDVYLSDRETPQLYIDEAPTQQDFTFEDSGNGDKNATNDVASTNNAVGDEKSIEERNDVDAGNIKQNANNSEDVSRMIGQNVESVKERIECYGDSIERMEKNNNECVTYVDGGLEEVIFLKNYKCVCGKEATAMCICKNVCYCSTECQSKDWEIHELICTYVCTIE